MSNEVIDTIQDGRKKKIWSYTLYNLAVILNNSYNYRHICIVEGKTDKSFYENINSYDLKTRVKYLWNFRDEKTYENSDVGKDAVIGSFISIKKNPKFYSYIDKLIFIIDHDYDGAKSMKYEFNLYRENKISITDGYSFENYFLEENNVKKIFYYLGKTDEDILRFEEKYKKFLIDTYEFFRLKSSTIEVKKKGSPCYDWYIRSYKTSLTNISKDIFEFNFKNTNYFNITKMYNEINDMRYYVNKTGNYSAKLFYNKYSSSLVLDRKYVRGHEALNFLIAYLRDEFDIELCDNPANKLYCELVRILDINFVIKNGLGEIIN